MRLLHTSDWHLGRSFHREDLLGAQAAFVDALVATVRSERVDAVVVAGDLYDRALPPVDAVRLCNEALARLAAERVRVVAISGNHDSAGRLGFAAGLIDAAGIHLRTDPARVGDPVLLEDRHGAVAVYAVPYLEPETARGALGCDGRSHAAVLGAAAAAARTDLSARAPGTRSVVVAHAFVAGGLPSDSERDISVGGVSAVPLDLLDGFSYAALGHLHGAQVLAPHVRYSGSPLAYSFSEEHQRKAAWLVDLDAAGVAGVERVDLPVPRRVARVSGTLDALLTDPRHAALQDAWLQVTLTDPVRPRAAMERLRARFPHALVLQFAPSGAQAPRPDYAARVSGLDDLAVALRFVEDVRSPADADEVALLREALEAQRRAEAVL
ncbi:exonuclease SbcCD subunit D [Vallicoccus soli]|uniref:Nuclease SbcCD subunit D n=1 Tax=Vallicoccus soli TaxID=2339232 RepID=A0A3A3YYL9_9ACTN|nr:exonuclease SbcCD subunit D [Vallicoccus soli]RJK93147.1 exonuclease SbcCD subunit D [Vallicoccus soli]